MAARQKWNRRQQRRSNLTKLVVRTLRKSQFARFLVVGMMNTLFGYSVFTVFVLLHVHYAIAALLSTICSIIFNFKTTGTLVFGSKNNKLVLKFVSVYAVTFLLNVLLLKLLTSLRIDLLLASALILLPIALVSYTLNKVLVFRS